MIIDLPLIICIMSCVFYGSMWFWNRGLIWAKSQYEYASYEEWFWADNIRGLWYVPLLISLFLPQEGQLATEGDFMAGFFWERLGVSVLVWFLAYKINKTFISKLF